MEKRENQWIPIGKLLLRLLSNMCFVDNVVSLINKKVEIEIEDIPSLLGEVEKLEIIRELETKNIDPAITEAMANLRNQLRDKIEQNETQEWIPIGKLIISNLEKESQGSTFYEFMLNLILNRVKIEKESILEIIKLLDKEELENMRSAEELGLGYYFNPKLPRARLILHEQYSQRA